MTLFQDGSQTIDPEMRPSPNIGPNVPAFLRKLWKIVNDPCIDDLVSWSADGESFVIKNPAEFCYNLLPIYYKHNNMSSFIRQLNMYGFHKISSENGCDKDEIRFFHPFFQQNESRLLQHIKRKIGTTKPEDRKMPLDQIGKVLNDVKQLRGRQESVDTQLSNMKQENAALWRELALLRQKHMKQQQIVNKLIHFLVSLVQQQPSRTTIGVKRRFPLMINDGPKSKAIKVTNQSSSSDGAVIHELDPETTQNDDNILGDLPTVTSPLSNSPMADSTDILDNIIDVNINDEEFDVRESSSTVDELLQNSENILPDFQANIENNRCNIDSIVNELEEVNTPQIVLAPDGKSLLNAQQTFLEKQTSPTESKKTNPKRTVTKIEVPELDVNQFLSNDTDQNLDVIVDETPDMTIATRTSPQDFNKLINSANDLGLHLNNTHGELETIKDMLYESGYTIDANTLLDLFNSNDASLSMDLPQVPLNEEEDWPSSSSNDQLFSGSELISYNPNDILNFENLLEQNDEEVTAQE